MPAPAAAATAPPAAPHGPPIAPTPAPAATSPASQDAAAIELIRRRGALTDAQAGRLAQAVDKCKGEWASLPGNYAQQGQRSISTLAAWYTAAGGSIA